MHPIYNEGEIKKIWGGRGLRSGVYFSPLAPSVEQAHPQVPSRKVAAMEDLRPDSGPQTTVWRSKAAERQELGRCKLNDRHLRTSLPTNQNFAEGPS